MAISITAPAQTSGAKSNAQVTIEIPFPSEQLLQNYRNSLIPLPDAVRNNPNLPAFVNHYYANTHQIREFLLALRERLSTRSFIPCPGGAKDVLMARVLFLTLELARASERQLRMQAILQSIDHGLHVKLDCLNAWKMVSVIFFTLAAAVTAVNVNPKRIAAATAATVLVSALGKGIHSLLKKPEIAVKKNRDIMKPMLMGAETIIKDLAQLYDLACELQSATACIWEMVDDGATDVAVREKVSALNNSFRKLQRKARSSSLDVSSASEAVLQRIIRNSD